VEQYASCAASQAQSDASYAVWRIEEGREKAIADLGRDLARGR
jgi:hypothetical protein